MLKRVFPLLLDGLFFFLFALSKNVIEVRMSSKIALRPAACP